ncbi:hypothetical protein V2G26_009912 [Clonostachys chloroleuca]
MTSGIYLLVPSQVLPNSRASDQQRSPRGCRFTTAAYPVNCTWTNGAGDGIVTCFCNGRRGKLQTENGQSLAVELSGSRRQRPLINDPVHDGAIDELNPWVGGHKSQCSFAKPRVVVQPLKLQPRE